MTTQEKKEFINDIYNNKNYIKCLQECLKLVKIINKNDIFSYDILFYLYYRIAIVYSMLGKYKLSLKYIKKSRMYAGNSEDIILVDWNYSYCYYKMNDIKNAIEYIEKAIHECLVIESEYLLYGALIHKALLTNDELLMLESINNIQIFEETDKKMDEYNTDLFMLYLNSNNIVMAKRVLNNINTISIKQVLIEKIYECIENI
jgi:tetratricopeptide (TPR) repeat protein